MNTVWSLKPSLVLFQVIGYSPFSLKSDNELENGRNMAFYSLGMIVLFAALASFSFIFDTIENTLESTIKFLLLVLIYATHFFTLIESFMKRHSQVTLISNFKEIDQTFQRKFHRNLYISLRQRLTKTMSFLIALIIAIFATDIAFYLTGMGNQERMSYLALFYIPYIMTFLRYLQIIFFIHMIKSRLEFIVEILREVVTKKNSAIVTTTMTFNTKASQFRREIFRNSVSPLEDRLSHLVDDQTIETLREIYNKLWQNSQLINTVFGFSILLNIGYDFLALITTAYWLFAEFSNPSISLYVNVINCIPHFSNVVVLAGICHYTTLAAKKVALLNHKIEFDVDNDNENLIVQQFSLQMLHQRIFFSANGFFDIDFTLLFTIVGSMTTYLVILIQFRMAQV